MKCPNCKNKIQKNFNQLVIMCRACNTKLKLKNSNYKHAIIGAISGIAGYWMYRFGPSINTIIVLERFDKLKGIYCLEKIWYNK